MKQCTPEVAKEVRQACVSATLRGCRRRDSEASDVDEDTDSSDDEETAELLNQSFSVLEYSALGSETEYLSDAQIAFTRFSHQKLRCEEPVVSNLCYSDLAVEELC